ncbi:MAG TPA: hypothetical protein DCP25_15505 [Chloroflexi bacterium]|jgi:O-antigen/teichoic acid export membrane protein|nr:hypothetical protein [Chloroflexota bacterium]
MDDPGQQAFEPGAIDRSNAMSGSDRGTKRDSSPVAARRFLANVIWMLVSQAAGKVAAFAFVIIVARRLGVTDYGYFNFALSIVPLFLMFGAWGIGIIVVAEVARDRTRLSEIFSSGFVLRAGLGLIGLLLCFGITPLLVRGTNAFVTVIILGFALFLDEVSGFLANVFKAFERMRYLALMTVTNRVVSVLLAVVAIAFGGQLLAVSAMYLLGSLSALVFAAVTIKRRFPPIRLADRSAAVMRQLLRQGLLVGAASVLNMALFRIDTVMLQAIRGPVEVGLYGIAYRFLDSFLFFAWGVTNAGLPRISRAEGRSERRRIFESLAALMLAFYVPLAVVGVFNADWIVSVLFSSKYAAAVPAVPWIAGASLFYAVAYLARVTAIVDGQRSAVVWIAAVGLIANVGANAIVIPRHGFLGAAVVTFASEVLDAALLLGLFIRSNGLPWATRLPAVPLVAGCCMSGALLLFPADGGVTFVIAAISYVIALPICGALLAPVESRRAIRLLRRQQPETSPG